MYQDNDLYTAMREGRVPVRIEMTEANGAWTASYDKFNVAVAVTDASQSHAHKEAVKAVLAKVRNREFVVKIA